MRKMMRKYSVSMTDEVRRKGWKMNKENESKEWEDNLHTVLGKRTAGNDSSENQKSSQNNKWKIISIHLI